MLYSAIRIAPALPSRKPSSSSRRTLASKRLRGCARRSEQRPRHMHDMHDLLGVQSMYLAVVQPQSTRRSRHNFLEICATPFRRNTFIALQNAAYGSQQHARPRLAPSDTAQIHPETRNTAESWPPSPHKACLDPKAEEVQLSYRLSRSAARGNPSPSYRLRDSG